MQVKQDNQSIVYKAEGPWTDQVKQKRLQLAELCGKHYNRPVRVQTIDGHTYEGTLVGTDGCHVHLMHFPHQGGHSPQYGHQPPYGNQPHYDNYNPYGYPSHSYGQHRFFSPSSAAAITTLVLYELLVITLLI